MMQYLFQVLCLNGITVTIGIAIILLFWKRAESEFTIRAWKCICMFMLIRLLVIVPGFIQISFSPNKQVQEITEDRLPNTETVNTETANTEKVSSEQNIANADTKQESPVIVSENTNVVKQDSTPLVRNSRKINSETVFTFVLLFYLLVVLFRITYAFISYVVLYCKSEQSDKIINDSRITNLLHAVLEEYGISKKVDVYYSKEILSPFILGYEEPFIVVPKKDYTLEQWEFIFRHECMHLKKKDMLPKMLLYIAESFHWINPFVHIFCRRVNDYLEECCDYYVVENKDVKYRKTYCYSILSILEKSINKNTRNVIGAINLNGGKKVMKKRINRILDVPVKKNKWLLLIGLYLMIGASVFLVGCEESIDNKNSASYSSAKEDVVKPVTTEEVTTEGTEAKNNWYQKTKLVTKDMEIRELSEEEIEKLVQLQQELFAGLSDERITEIKKKVGGAHFWLESAIVYYDYGTLTDPNPDYWQWFEDTIPDDNVETNHFTSETIQELEDVKEKLSDTRVINLITEAQNEIQAIVDKRSNVHVMKAHMILHDLDYWLFRCPPEGFEEAPADWTGINIYFGELDEILND